MNAIESAEFLRQHPELTLPDEFIRDFEAEVDRDLGLTDRLAKAREKRKSMIDAGLLSSIRNPDERMAEKPTPKRAIAAMCFWCMGRCKSWRSDVRDCTSSDCPLFVFRPGVKTVQESPERLAGGYPVGE